MSEDRAIRNAAARLLGRPVPSHEALERTSRQLVHLADQLGLPAAPGSRCCDLHTTGLAPAVAGVVAILNTATAGSAIAAYAQGLLANLPRELLARCCDPNDCGPCCPECPTCPTLNPTYVLLAMTHLPPDTRPHGRSCGYRCPAHGPDCGPDCPTCHPQARLELVRDVERIHHPDLGPRGATYVGPVEAVGRTDPDCTIATPHGDHSFAPAAS